MAKIKSKKTVSNVGKGGGRSTTTYTTYDKPKKSKQAKKSKSGSGRVASSALSDRLMKRVGKSTAIKLDENGKRVGGGTKITSGLVDKVMADEDNVLEIIEDNSEQVLNAIDRALAEALEEIGMSAERFAKAKCPVDTGRLRNSITFALDVEDEAVYVGTNVEYAPYQEFGTHGKDGKHFLRDAANGHGAYYAGIIKKHLQNG